MISAVCPWWSFICAVPQNPLHVLLFLSLLVPGQHSGSAASQHTAQGPNPTPRASVMVQNSRF